MPGILNKQISWRTSAVIVFLLVVVFPIACMEAVRWKPLQFWRRYDQLQLGMSEADAEKLFKRKPDCVCTIGSNRVLYWCRDAITDHHPKSPAVIAANQREIPFNYGCAQLLFDAEGKLSAHTVASESLYVYTREGNLKGADLAAVNPAVFERLRLAATQ